MSAVCCGTCLALCVVELLLVCIAGWVDADYWQKRSVPSLVHDLVALNESVGVRYRQVGSERELLAVISQAARNGTNVRAVGGGWSWNPGAFPVKGGIALGLGGELSRIDPVNCPRPAGGVCEVTVGGGSRIADVTKEVLKHGLQLSAIAGCITSDRSQSVGGMIATNVHHSFTPTIADGVSEVRVAHFGPGSEALVESYRQDHHDFKYFFGTVGRAGLVTSAVLALEPLTAFKGCFKKAANLTLPALEAMTNASSSPEWRGCSWRLESQWLNRHPLDASLEERCVASGEPSERHLGLQEAPANPNLAQDALEALAIFERQVFRGALQWRLMEFMLAPRGCKEGRYHNRHSCLGLQVRTMSMELFVPYSHAQRALQTLEELLQSEDDLVLVNPRFVPRTRAALAPSSGADVLAVNINAFFTRDWRHFSRLQGQILRQWRERDRLPFVRVHPGKFIMRGEVLEYGGFPDEAMRGFYELLGTADPSGVFRTPFLHKDMMVFEYASRTPTRVWAILLCLWLVALAAVLSLLGGLLEAVRALALGRGGPREGGYRRAPVDCRSAHSDKFDRAPLDHPLH